MTAIKVELDKAAFRTARECAFEAMRAARRARELVAEIIDVAAELGTMPAELPAALIAAHQANEAAKLAEFAAVDPKVRDPYRDARRHYQLTLRHEQSCALALRRLSARIPNYSQLVAAVDERKRLQREFLRAPNTHEAEAPPYSISVEGESSDVSLRKAPLNLDVEPLRVPKPTN